MADDIFSPMRQQAQQAQMGESAQPSLPDPMNVDEHELREYLAQLLLANAMRRKSQTLEFQKKARDLYSKVVRNDPSAFGE